MGGKTVALKTVVLLQLAAQRGFFVPARRFETCLFSSVAVVWGDPEENAAGLSAFGLEMDSFNRAWNGAAGPLLLVMDEFARTTNASEASALISAVLGQAAANRNVYALLATHFRAALPGRDAAALRMEGFDTAAFDRHFRGRPPVELREKLKMINRFMRYRLISDKTGDEPADALKIAAILGVPAGIIKTARRFASEAHQED
jgi:dsDNA-specific endonuclease/ATPase MutS2